jgi:hypothetical protein
VVIKCWLYLLKIFNFSRREIGGDFTTKGGVIAILQSIGAADLSVTRIFLTATNGAVIIGGEYMLKYKGD